jgi:hypothetical protein
MKVKRTYRLPSSTVEAVREMVERRHLALTQDALVEMAIEDLAMTVRHADEAQAFRIAAEDPELAAEAAGLDRDFAPLDDESWPA